MDLIVNLLISTGLVVSELVSKKWKIVKTWPFTGHICGHRRLNQTSGVVLPRQRDRLSADSVKPCLDQARASCHANRHTPPAGYTAHSQTQKTPLDRLSLLYLIMGAISA